jgi:uncharacterized membrane protein
VQAKIRYGVAIVCLALAGCATQPKTYQAPDSTVVNAATRDLTVKVKTARNTADKAKGAAEDAQKNLDVVVDLGKTVNEKIDTLKQKHPEQYRPLVEQVEIAKSEEDVQVEIVRAKASESVKWNTQLQGELEQAETARKTLQSAQDAYAGAAAGLAEDASNERAARIKAEQSLHWYRWHFFLTWFIAGAGLLVCILLAFLKFTGRLSLGAAAIASKLP